MLKKCSNLQRAGICILALLLVCTAVSCIGVFTSRGLFIPVEAEIGEITVSAPELVSCEAVEGGILLTSHGTGTADISSGGSLIAIVRCSNHFIYDWASGQYTGAVWVRGAVLVFLAGTLGILIAALIRQVKTSFFHYATPLTAAFVLLVGMTLLMVVVPMILFGNNRPEDLLSVLPSFLNVLTLPIMVVFALSMFVSNLSLLRHEGRTWRNLLGSLIGLGISVAGLAILFGSDASGSIDDIRLKGAVVNLFSGLVLWTECKLAGIIFCGIRAARHQPQMDKDYILILGCKLSKKGGLTPLLRGRVDRALDFARKQQEKTGKMPVLIPCGGKGRDEMQSEAAAMKAYLLEKGVPEEGILAEDRSANTWENIRNAQAMMKPGAKVAYATTNYHVFRAGVWASRNGLEAEGMGSRTKWYYWPNAFMREYVALIAANWVHELVMLALIGIQSGLLALLYF